MNTVSFVPRSRVLVCAVLCASGVVALPAQAAAQDSAFIACERFSDRGQRIACLEDALEAATAADASPAESAAPPAAAAPPMPAPAPQAAVPQVRAAEPTTQQPTNPAAVTAGEQEDPSLIDRLRNFGRGDGSATLSIDESGQDRLHDTIAGLEKRRDAWIVTLASGQVWMQDYPRELALREGDQVTIYRAGFGNGYRLSTERLSGFIRVKRVR